MIDPKFVYQALATGLITEAEAQAFLDPEPVEATPDREVDHGDRWSSNADRLQHVIDGCASGAPAFTVINTTGIEEIATGRILPAPPSTTTGETT